MFNVKKSVVLIVFLLVIGIVSAAIGINEHSSKVFSQSMTPSPSYEFAQVEVQILIQNNDTNDNINQVKFETDKLQILGGTGLNKWTLINTTNQISWSSDESSISNGGIQPFTFIALVSELSADYTEVVNVTTTDENNGTSVTIVSFAISNDDILPRYTVNSPLNFSYQKNESYTFSITANDDESGVAGSPMIYYNWDDDTSSPFGNLNNVLASNGGAFTSVINLNTGTLDTDYYFFYYFNVSDKAGNNNVKKWHYIYVDDEQPTLSINSPADGTSTNGESQTFSYNMGDNSFATSGELSFNPSVSCSLYFVNTSTNLIVVHTNTSNVTAGIFDINFAGNGISDGVYSWYVTCEDLAGWSTQGVSRTVTIDRVGPEISLTSHGNNAVVNNTDVLTFSITDTPSGVEDSYSDPAGLSASRLDTSVLSGGLNNVQIYANDTLGNKKNENFTILVDTTAPIIVLNTPVNNSYNSNLFNVTPTDDFSGTITCSIFVDDILQSSLQGNNASIISFSPTILEGSKEWKVSCTDMVGNVAESETRTVIVDTINPVVTLLAPINGDNYPNGVAEFNYSQTDTNLQNDCGYFVYNISGDLVTSSATPNISVPVSNSPYHWNSSCNDLAGNKGWSNTETFYYDTITPELDLVVNSSITHETVTISWVVDEVSNNTVYYGTNSSLLTSSVNSPTLSSTPSIQVNVVANTLYFYITQSCDQFGYCTNTTTWNFTSAQAPASPAAVSSGGGGGSSSNTRSCADGYKKIDGVCQLIVEEDKSSCTPLWKCNEWTECLNGEQTRVCEDWSVCGVEDGKPSETKTCTQLEVRELEESLDTAGTLANEDGSDPVGVGAATGIFTTFQSNWKSIIGAMAILSLLGLAFWKKSLFSSGVSKLANIKGSKLRREEEEIRKKLREQGLIK